MMNRIPPKRVFLSCLVLLATACLILVLWAAIAAGVFRISTQPDNSFNGTAWQSLPISRPSSTVLSADFTGSFE
jgi:hypothetical protein